jgi:membrane associated rhomboid family serine protease
VSVPVPSRSTEPEKPSLAEPLQQLLVVAGMLAVMWVLEIIDLLPGVDLDGWGIRPRTWRGLWAIPVAPFLHSGLSHLIANTIPFAVLGAVIALGSLSRFLEVTVIVALSSGLGIWLFGSSGTIHIGASGLVFGYLTYLVARGFIAGRPLWVVGGIVVALFYGGILWGLLPRPGISFAGHLFGALGGLLAAWVLHGKHTSEDGSDLPDATRSVPRP